MLRIFKKNTSGGHKVIRTLPSSNNSKVIGGKRRGLASKPSISAKILAWLSAVSFFGVTVYILFFSPMLAINSISVEGNEIVPVGNIIETIGSSISGKNLGFVNKNNIILSSKGKIRRDVLSRFKQIEDVEISKGFPDKITAKIKEYHPSLVFCSGESCYVLDENGKSYAKADFQANEFGESNLVVFSDQSQKSIDGEVRVDRDLVEFVTEAKSRLKRDLEIEMNRECETPTLVSEDIKVETVGGWKIYFNKAIGIDKEIEMLRTVLNNNIDKSRISELEYIDLRLDNKVYYKFR